MSQAGRVPPATARYSHCQVLTPAALLALVTFSPISQQLWDLPWPRAPMLIARKARSCTCWYLGLKGGKGDLRVMPDSSAPGACARIQLVSRLLTSFPFGDPQEEQADVSVHLYIPCPGKAWLSSAPLLTFQSTGVATFL